MGREGGRVINTVSRYVYVYVSIAKTCQGRSGRGERHNNHRQEMLLGSGVLPDIIAWTGMNNGVNRRKKTTRTGALRKQLCISI